jgi:hypothetical protein
LQVSVITVSAFAALQPISWGLDPDAAMYPFGAHARAAVSHLIPQPPLALRTFELVHAVLLAPLVSPTMPFRLPEL